MQHSSKQLNKGRMEIQWNDVRNLLYSGRLKKKYITQVRYETFNKDDKVIRN